MPEFFLGVRVLSWVLIFLVSGDIVVGVLNNGRLSSKSEVLNGKLSSKMELVLSFIGVSGTSKKVESFSPVGLVWSKSRKLIADCWSYFL